MSNSLTIIMICNDKGGVGKTFEARTLSEYYSIVKKKRTLGIDFDPQGNYSSRFLKMKIDPYNRDGRIPPIHPEYDPEDLENGDWDGITSIADIFFGNEVIPYSTAIENLDLIPAHSSKLRLVERVRQNEVASKVYEQTRKFLSLEEIKELYDVIIIDTPPSKGPLTVSVMRAATHVIIPAQMEPGPLEGIEGMLSLWKTEALRRDNEHPLNLIGINANMFDRRTRMHCDYLDDLRKKFPKYVMESVIPRLIIFSEVDSEGAMPPSIFSLPDSHKAKQALMTFCDEVDSKINAREQVYA